LKEVYSSSPGNKKEKVILTTLNYTIPILTRLLQREVTKEELPTKVFN
jgi:hypothetical protein